MRFLQYSKFIEWLFFGALVYIGSSVAADISAMKTSVSELNQKMAVIISKTSDHDQRLADQEARIRELEFGKREH